MTTNCARCDAEGQSTADALPAGWIAQVSTKSPRTFPVCGKCAEGGNSSQTSTGDTAADQLRLLIERIERIEEEIKGSIDDRKDVYGEAKATGFDTKTIRAIVHLRKMDPHSRMEADALLETYKAALGIE